MFEHSRLALEQMGIDVWVPMDTPTRFTTNSLYSDMPYNNQDISSAINNPPEPIFTAVQPEQPEPTLEIKEQDLDVVAQDNPTPESPLLAPIESFHIQFMILPHCAVALDIRHLEALDLELWTNIQKAVPHELCEFLWPMPMELPNTDSGLSAYFRGFIAANIRERPLITLGRLPVESKSILKTLPSITELRENPSLKRELWNRIKNS